MAVCLPLFFIYSNYMGALKTKGRVKLFPRHTDVYQWIKSLKCRFVVLQGGTSSSKTYSILQLLCKKAIEEPGVKIDVVAMTAESLAVGCITDFKRLIDTSTLLRSMLVKPGLQKGPFIFKNGSIIRFRNLDGGDKARHGKRDYLFLNECNTLNYETARQLMMRTAKQVYIDYNPDAEFWVHHEVIPRDDCFFAVSNFTHNPFVAEGTIIDLFDDRQKWLDSIVKNAEGEVVEENTYWRNQWEVYGLGLTGVVEGVIYKNVEYVNQLPIGLSKRAFALDFGFANDPTALSVCGMLGNDVYGKELLYETGLTTPDIMEHFEKVGVRKAVKAGSGRKGFEGDLIIADSSNLDAIAQMQRAGYNVVPAKKGPGSVLSGINQLQQHTIYLTSGSLNWAIERSNYKYKKVGGKWLNEPQKGFDHLWDGMRYWYQFFHKPTPKKSRRRVRRVRKLRIN
jgi:phage terminase large subunit